jgi:hypothetical protein
LAGIDQKSFQEGEMKVLERMIQKVGDWQALEELDHKYTAVESKNGFPAKRRYRGMSAPNNVDTLVIEREWDSMAAFDKAFDSVMADPEWNDLNAGNQGVVLSTHVEFYFVM